MSRETIKQFIYDPRFSEKFNEYNRRRCEVRNAQIKQAQSTDLSLRTTKAVTMIQNKIAFIKKIHEHNSVAISQLEKLETELGILIQLLASKT